MEYRDITSSAAPVRRTQTWYLLLLFVVSLLAVRLFYLQIIPYDYHHQALSDQQKQYTIPANRGSVN